MARKKNDKVFDLFKRAFKITFFYKPTNVVGDMFYYITLDDVIRLKVAVIRNAIVIDDVIPLTHNYITPLYEKMVSTIMNQTEQTVLISLLGNTSVVHQACVKCGAPMVEDERYITVAKSYYSKIKASSKSIAEYGFYILSVSEMEDTVDEIGKETVMMKVTNKIKTFYPKILVNAIDDNTTRFTIEETDEFIIECSKQTIMIRGFCQPGYVLNFVKIVDFINLFESFLDYTNDVYIVGVNSEEVYRICTAKNYELLSEPTMLNNKIFKQVFHGFGTFRLLHQNNN